MSASRRTFLQSALLLPSAFAARAFAQDSTGNSTPFASFENGSWNNWTTQGEGFGIRPATDALFPGKIRGFSGRGFASSLHPRKGNAATGKLISPEFTIDQPFITFRIGGGNYPGQACLNLIIDGKIVKSTTGTNTASLQEDWWDVSSMVGRKAHLEVVDTTVSEQRGYIMVDHILFTGNQPSRLTDVLVTGMMPVHLRIDNLITVPANMKEGRVVVVNRLPLPTTWCDGPKNVNWKPSGGKSRKDDALTNPFVNRLQNSFQCQPYPSQGMIWEGSLTDVQSVQSVSCDYDLIVANRVLNSQKYMQLTVQDLAGIPASLQRALTQAKKTIAPDIATMAQSQIARDNRLVTFVQQASDYCGQVIKRGVKTSTGKFIQRYDAEVTFREGRGWCGPQSSLFRAFCIANGIPAREVSGYVLKRLNVRNGEINMNDTRGVPDATKDGNAHVWAEVFLPTVGWIEVNVGARNCYAIPSTFIKVSGVEAPFIVYIEKSGRRHHDSFSPHITVTPQRG